MDGSTSKNPVDHIREVTLPDTPLTVPSKKKAFRRRSSITDLEGRRSGTFCRPPDRCFAAYAELYQGIPQDLSESERLEQLNRNCFQYALEKLEQEFDHVDTLPENLEKARVAFETVSDNLKKSGQYQKAVELNCQSPSKKQNSEIEETLEDYERVIKQLEAEDKSWKNLLNQHKTAALNVQGDRIINEAQHLHLSPKDQALLSGHVDCHKLLQNLRNSREALKVQLSSVETCFRSNLHYCEKAEEICRVQIKRLRDMVPQADQQELILRLQDGWKTDD